MPTPRTLSEAFGPYARLDLVKPRSRYLRAAVWLRDLVGWLCVAFFAGFAWSYALHLLERVR